METLLAVKKGAACYYYTHTHTQLHSNAFPEVYSGIEVSIISIAV